MPLLTITELEQLSPLFRGRYGNAFAQRLLGMLSIDKVTALYERNEIYKGPEFARHVLQDIGVNIQITGREHMEKLPHEGAFITVSNHPYGSIDGIALVNLLGHIRPDYKIMVNKFLARIACMEENFITVTPMGNERGPITKESIAGLRATLQHLHGGHPVGFFPSGAVSDLNLCEGRIRDRQWQESVLRLIQKAKVPVIPVCFRDRNSAFYYLLGLIGWRIRVLRLAAEVFNKKGKPMRIAIGPVISVAEQSKYKDIKAYGKLLRASVQALNPL